MEQLADRKEGIRPANSRSFESIVPLGEMISACVGVSSASKKVQRLYEQMLQTLGSEFEILREIPLEDIRKESGLRMAEGIEKLRKGEINRMPGFDGEYGKISIWEE